MVKPKIEVIQTRDGSSSLLLPEMDETYHSTHGAITESKYVFLDKGLNFYHQAHPEKELIRILEIGFGTGLNIWLTALAVQNPEHRFKVECTTIEKFPLDQDVISQLNYMDMEHSPNARAIFEKIHLVEWENQHQIHPNMRLCKHERDIIEYDLSGSLFDVIYFDAFAPSKQPDMWRLPILQKMNQLLIKGGILVTYCAQGQFKRDLKAAGFDVESLDGPPGKKEMTRGVKV